MNEIIEMLEKLAGKKNLTDDETIFEISGGNYDDAYYAGFEDGRSDLAGELLLKLKSL